ncbi:MAG: hypothetical protein U0703_09955 [Anaerolineae bacterium]
MSHSRSPQRIVLILPCCIGDVVLATAALQALRRAYPDAHIVWAVGSWSKPAVEHHPLLDGVIDTGAEALPVRTLGGLLRFVRQLRAGKFDSPCRCALAADEPCRAAVVASPSAPGSTAPRGFGYTVRARTPERPGATAEIYLDVIRALGIDTAGCYASVPVSEADRASAASCARRALTARPRGQPGGRAQPRMVMDAKRYPPEQLAALANRSAPRWRVVVVLIGGRGDEALVEAAGAAGCAAAFVGALSFGEIVAALARVAAVSG